MKKKLIAAAALLVGCYAATASAAVPEFGTKEGELACTGLMAMGFQGATASQPQKPQAVVSIAIAYSFYIGRLSVAAPNATKPQTESAASKLTLEEENTYVAVCLKKASEAIGPHLGAGPA